MTSRLVCLTKGTCPCDMSLQLHALCVLTLMKRKTACLFYPTICHKQTVINIIRKLSTHFKILSYFRISRYCNLLTPLFPILTEIETILGFHEIFNLKYKTYFKFCYSNKYNSNFPSFLKYMVQI